MVNVSEWKDKKRKMCRDSGKSFISRTGKQILPKIAPDSPKACSESCRKDCGNLRIQKVRDIFTKFYDISYDEQSLVLLRYISLQEPIRRRPGITDSSSRRLATFKYKIENVDVCKKTFCNVFQISLRRVDTLQTKLKNGDLSPKDRRGCHTNRPHTLDNNVRNLIKSHIGNFPS
ncbi:uncharacterized protein LOC123314937 [Coccinella septempunctata]|uniref:uncharacterized protein LOC123314937 n=1 Tax=Coccinella septempunctata TaxID=41139 RepID=UPI001D09667A|nr:uncharacterized protein LOC123314937 [Coccinella septempunctata]